MFRNSLSNVTGSESRRALTNSIRDNFARLTGTRESRSETFEEAVRRLGLSEADLRERLAQFVIMSRLLYGAAAATLVLSLHYASNGFILAVLSCLCVAGLLACYAIPNAMRAWQIKNRRMCAFADWARDAGNWLV
jgi:hypothetical protein